MNSTTPNLHSAPTGRIIPPRPAPRRRRRSLWLGAAAFALAGGIALAAGTGALTGKPAAPQRTTQSKDAKAERRTIDVLPVEQMSFDITTTSNGELRARNQIEIRNTLDRDTTITEIVPEGQTVAAGDVLVRLNGEDIETQLEEESLALESSRAAVVEAEQAYEIQVSENDSAMRDARLKLELAELDLQKWRQGEVQSRRQELDHALDRAQKDEQRLRDKLDKSRSLFERGYYSLDLLKQDELAFGQATNTLAKAELDKSVYWDFEHPKAEKERTSAVEEARANVERVSRQNTSRMASKEADRTNRRQALAIREQKFAKLQEQLAATTLKAPSAGLVVYSTSMENARWGNDDGPLQVGTRVYPNQLLIILPDTSEMVAAVKVHESLAGRVRPGQRASIRIDAAGDQRFTGTVESIGILAEQTSRWMDPNLREYTVRVVLDDVASAGGTDDQRRLKPSMRCEAELLLGRVDDVLAVPLQAVFNEGALRYVHIEDGGSAGGRSGRFERRPVQVGQRSERFAEIKTGVAAGERVLVRKPEPGEIINAAWDPEELAAIGLKIDAQGQIVSATTARPGSDGSRFGRAPEGAGGRPGASGKSLPPDLADRLKALGVTMPGAAAPSAPTVEATTPSPAAEGDGSASGQADGQSEKQSAATPAEAPQPGTEAEPTAAEETSKPAAE